MWVILLIWSYLIQSLNLKVYPKFCKAQRQSSWSTPEPRVNYCYSLIGREKNDTRQQIYKRRTMKLNSNLKTYNWENELDKSTKMMTCQLFANLHTI